MRPERFLGSDPAPGDLGSVDSVAGALRTVVRALAESRQRVEAVVGPRAVWHGALARPVVSSLTDLAARLRAIEDSVVDFARAVESWRTGLVVRQQRCSELTETVSRLAGRADAEPERQHVLAEVQRLAADHAVAGSRLIAAADGLAEVLADTDRDGDLAADLDRGVTVVLLAVERWIAESSAELLATAESVSDTADLTSVVFQLLGVAGDRPPDERENVRRLASRSAGAHRLRRTLGRSWTSLAPEALPAASFADGGSDRPAAIPDRLRGPPNPEHGGRTP